MTAVLSQTPQQTPQLRDAVRAILLGWTSAPGSPEAQSASMAFSDYIFGPKQRSIANESPSNPAPSSPISQAEAPGVSPVPESRSTIQPQPSPDASVNLDRPLLQDTPFSQRLFASLNVLKALAVRAIGATAIGVIAAFTGTFLTATVCAVGTWSLAALIGGAVVGGLVSVWWSRLSRPVRNDYLSSLNTDERAAYAGDYLKKLMAEDGGVAQENGQSSQKSYKTYLERDELPLTGARFLNALKKAWWAPVTTSLVAFGTFGAFLKGVAIAPLVLAGFGAIAATIPVAAAVGFGLLTAKNRYPSKLDIKREQRARRWRGESADGRDVDTDFLSAMFQQARTIKESVSTSDADKAKVDKIMDWYLNNPGTAALAGRIYSSTRTSQ